MKYAVLFFSLILSLIPPAAFGAERPWLEVRSPNFVVVTNAGEKQARRTAGQFERIRSVFQQGLGLKVDPGKPIVIVAARDEATHKALVPGFYERKGQTRHAGFFQPGEDKHYVEMRLDLPGEQAYHIIYHEYVHMLVNLNFPMLPVWLNEGLAELYGNSVIMDKEVGVGRPNEHSLMTLQQGRLLPMDELFGVDHSSAHYNEANKASIFYAQAWALTHYLTFIDKGVKLKVFFELLIKDVAPADAAAQAFGNPRELEKKLADYVRLSAYYYHRMPLRLKVDEPGFQLRELRAGESLAVRGDLLVHMDRPVEAQALLEESVRLEPNLAAASESLGFLHLRKGEHDKAAEWFEKAAGQPGAGYLAHYYLGRSKRAEAEAEQAEAALKKATELNPQFAPAWAELGALYSRRPDGQEEALKMALQAVQLDPGRIDYRLNVGYILVNLDRFEEARRVAQQAASMAQTPEQRMIAERFVEMARRRQESVEEIRRAEEQVKALRRAEEEEIARAEAAAAQRPAEDPPRAATEVAPAAPEAAPKLRPTTSVRREAIGTVTSVKCIINQKMEFTVGTAKGEVLLHTADFMQVEFFSLTWKPPDPFLPCDHLQGLAVRVTYYPLTGMRHAGEVLRVDVTKESGKAK